MSPEDRSRERYRRAAWSIAASVGAKGVALLVILVSVPLTVRYLGPERFGIWMALSSLSVVLSFLDLGLGNALVNATARAAAAHDERELRRTVSDGTAVMCGVGALAALVLLPLAWLVPGEWLFRDVSPGLHAEIREALVLFVALFAVGIPLQGLQRIAAGLQEAWLAHAVAAAGSAVSLALVVLLARQEAPIPALVAATYGVQVLAPAALAAILARRRLLGRPGGWPQVRGMFASLRGIGGMFLVLQLTVIVGWGADNFIVAALLGAPQVAALALVQRLFDFAYAPLAVLNAPLWAAYADAQARGERAFIGTTLARSMTITLGLAVAAFAFIVAMHETIFALWVESVVPIPAGLVTACGVWFVLQAVGNAFAMYLNGVGIVRPQMATSIAFVAIGLSAKLAFVGAWGTTAVPAITAAAYALAVMLPYLTIFRESSLRPIRLA